MQAPFDTPIDDSADLLVGPLRGPRQMLATQQYDNHTSIHDDATAQKLGFKGGTIEGPTHFSQFVPLCVALWGTRWLESGCLSAHYRNPCFEGERVRAFVARPKNGETQTTIWMQREDGVEILRGTAAVGSDNPPSALEQRIKDLAPPDRLVILHDVSVGMRGQRMRIRMDANQHMGHLYPFSLADKLKVITENSPWYSAAGAGSSPWGRAIIPVEMISVLLNHSRDANEFPVRGPVVGLFADQEIRLIGGPLFVGEDYEIEREVVALSGSRRTESMWIRTRVMKPGSDEVIATMLLNSASLKDSYANYARDLAALES
ncbi:MAG TPA: hypothetical protein PKE27_13700 [Povalibacter sp.]|nr:hypothetical protein [Povalibacter sp.]HMN45634.1 hypothetical protein [Povalibacter sp.]